MQIYTLHFLWSPGETPERPGPHNIPASNNGEAMAAAKALFEGQRFSVRPDGYNLFDQAGNQVFQFRSGR